MKDHHLHPFLNKELKYNRSENILKLDAINVIIDLDCSDTLVVLQENNKIEEAIDNIITKFRLYIEYLHWSNCTKLFGFINHCNNIFVLNGNYDMRRMINEKLHDIYRVQDINRKNQIITKIAS